jgi:hypothetical protein
MTAREWVLTEAGRQEKLGTKLVCKKCGDETAKTSAL